MDARGYRLGVDFGTSNTVAMLVWPDGHVRPLLFDGSPTLPSAVYADAQQGLLTGRDAMHAARISPERYEPNPKRRIDEPAVLLGEHEIPTVDLIAAVLARVAAEARRVSGGALGPATITCPAAWAQTRRSVLLAAAQRAGLGAVTLVPEPVAAAEVFRTMGGQNAPQARPGSAFVVYDLGAGTFDASVVRHGNGSFQVLSAEGLSTSGGLDIDASIVGYLGAVHGGHNPEAWRSLTHPTTSAERRAHRLLWDDVRNAKEMLSRTSSTMIHVPALETDVPLGRDQLEQLARPILTATVTSTRAAIGTAGLTPSDIEGVFLVGGGSRIPLVATLLHQALGIAPTVVEQPELVVAQGAVGASAQFTTPNASAVVPPVPSSPPTTRASAAVPVSAPPPPAPTSAVPVSGGDLSAAPVSPGFAATPVSAGPMSTTPLDAAPVSGHPYGAGPTSAGPVSGNHAGNHPVSAPPPASPRPPVTTHPLTTPAGPFPQQPEQPRAKKRTGVLIAAALAVLLVLAGGAYGINQYLNRNTGTGNSAGNGGDSTSSGSDETQADEDRPSPDWATTAEEFDEKAGTTIAYHCPNKGWIGTVYGTGVYTTSSSVCTAAVHDGRITLEDGGRVVIKIIQGQDSYEASLQHGINTTAYGPCPWAFQIIS
ncbi:Hsp70 family protein [Dactylosporangium matsuzakiense]|uniref:LCCL domain-containing protein n=1 Tax=Dactylosporangium matsuzakiense TaxID=53360 RepID=A0A9W6KM89_9ACTN|nr:Hsp70 family protein [Dactylosporangium matsuzakiense]UWZ43580.1 Hsp70 family protein [Dactylosporangium matsuzakiense]GLL04088.1 hypothetical protein GCM10017581_058350 [Dactylosporangium matsuzakiense]